MCFGKNKAKKAANVAIADQAASVDKLLADAAAQREADKTAQETLLTSLTANSDKQIAALNSQNATLLTQLGSQAGSFQATQQGLIDAQNKATQQAADSANAILKQRDQTAQAVKAPNYLDILKRQKALNSGGLSSTMLTGASGVTGALPLGGATLLGA